jgi:hypothetical protein
LVVIPVIAGALACTGCRPEGLHRVSGKVLYRGEPAAGATVYFHGNGAAGPAEEIVPMGTAQEDGRFSIATGDADGAPAGTYKLLIEWLDKPSTSKGGARVVRTGLEQEHGKTARTQLSLASSRVRPPDRLKGRYFNVEHPRLIANVTPGTNNLGTIELTD